MAGTTVVFTPNGGSAYTLADNNVVTSKVEGPRNSPTLDISTLKVSRNDGEKPISSQYEKRPILLEGKLIDSSPGNLVARLDALKAAVAGYGTLDITFVGDVTKRYFVYVKNFLSPDAAYQLTWVPYSIEFEADDPPFGEDPNVTSTLYTNAAVAANISQTSTILGSAEGNVSIQVGSLPAGAAIVELINSRTGDNLQVSRTWQTQDILNFNSGNKSVSVNAVSSDYTGNILRFPPGSNAWQINFLPSTGIDVSQLVYNTERAIGTAGIYYGQTFDVGSSYNLSRIDLLLYKIGSPGDLTYRVYKLFGVPGQTLIATGTILAADINTIPTWTPVTFTPAAVTAAESPYLVEVKSATNSNVDNAIFWKSSNENPYGAGFMYDDIIGNGSPNDVSDFCFKIWKATTVAGLNANVLVNYRQRWL